MQARSASERNPRRIPVTAARIPLLALRAWMKAGAAYSHASPKRKREESAPRMSKVPRQASLTAGDP